MTIETQNKLVEKSKTKKDGVYTFGGYYYAVKEGGLVAFSDYDTCYACYGSFNTPIGKLSFPSKGKQALKDWLKKNK